MKPLSLYIHWPFCLSKCPYCDFSSRVMPGSFEEEIWTQAYLRAIEDRAVKFKARPIRSIYFGGGTPSLMSPSLVAQLLDKITATWSLQDNCEITLEANPSSSAREKFNAFKQAGINRLSLGVQALDDKVLSFLGRAHDAKTALEALDAARQVFPRVSFDMIYGYAGHNAQDWRKQLRQVLEMAPQHVSLYQLTIEKNTSFGKRAQNGETLAVDEDLAARLYELTQDLTESFGLPAYEISNHAKPWQESRHNLTYWRYDDYLGIGPAAHGRVAQEGGGWLSYENEKNPETWLSLLDSLNKGVTRMALLSAAVAQKEALMTGLRLRKGIDKADWKKKFSHSVMSMFDEDKKATLVEEGFLEETPTHLSLTKAGRQRLDAVLAYVF